jgi:hypothetical protein
MRYLKAKRTLCAALSLFTACALSACDTLFGPDDEVVLGRLSYLGHPSFVQVPDTVLVGVSFNVVARTYGGGCISYGYTDVEYTSPGVIDVRPYDIDSLEDVCTDDLSLFDHTAELAVDSPGTWVIQFHGRQIPPDTVIIIERSVYAK